LIATRIFTGGFFFWNSLAIGYICWAYRTTKGSSEGGVGWVRDRRKTPIPKNSNDHFKPFFLVFLCLQEGRLWRDGGP
jgi:hypothetical protein